MVATAYFANDAQQASGWSGAERLDRLGPSLDGQRLDPGETILIGFPEGREAPFFWRETVARITVSGSADQPARLAFGQIGEDGDLIAPTADTPAFFRQTGAAFPVQATPDPSGQPFLVLESPQALTLTGPRFDGAGAKGFFRISGRGQGVRITDVHARMAGRVIETEEGSAIDGLEVSRASGFGLIRGFARFHRLTNARFADLDLDAGGIDGGGTRVCQLVSVIAGDGLTFERVHLRRAVNLIDATARGSTYVQGDGIVLEEETANARFTDCHARDLGDAGFDLKCDGILLTRCSMRRCKYGVRVWRNNADNLLDMCVISDPAPRPKNAAACVWVGGQVTLRHCLLATVPDAAAIRFGMGPDTEDRMARMIGGRIDLSAGGALLAGEPGRLELDNVLIDGTPTSGTATWTGDRLILP